MPILCGGRTPLSIVVVGTQADAYSEEELAQKLDEMKVQAPKTGNALSPPQPFNLMVCVIQSPGAIEIRVVLFVPGQFASDIGPSGYKKGFLRPETAQGIFTNFKKLLKFNNGMF